MIAGKRDAYVMQGDPTGAITPKIADMRARRADAGGKPTTFGMAAYAIVRDSAAEVVGHPVRARAQDQKYSVSNRGLRPIWSARPSNRRNESLGMKRRGTCCCSEPADGRDGALRSADDGRVTRV